MSTFKDFQGILPYASELFGVHQPLLGWKSRRIKDRFEKVRSALYGRVAERLLTAMRSDVNVTLRGDDASAPTWLATRGVEVGNLQPVRFLTGQQTYVASKIDSGVARLLRRDIDDNQTPDWSGLVTRERMTALLKRVNTIVINAKQLEKNPEVAEYLQQFLAASPNPDDRRAVLQAFFEREAIVAGYLVFLANQHPSGLERLFKKDRKVDLFNTLQSEDPLLSFGANEYDAVLSPVGIVHLYRQYFFEFDSFLGPPVGHVWLSPGGTVELIEINTRKTFTERSFEMMTETVTRTETAVITQDDLADAVKDENQSNIKFGFTNVASYTTPVFQDTATASFALDNAKSHTRETTHNHMRQQSEKLSSEIKKNFKTTFKTSTEVTDTTSKRYVLQNTTNALVNYELRRKMRKVGVQMQDIGVQLCWHTFVDDPSHELGIAQLVHIAQPSDLTDVPQPDQPVTAGAVLQDVTLNIPFVGTDTDDADIAYTNGKETEVGWAFDDTNHIEADFAQSVTFDQPKYTLSQVTLDPQGADAQLSVQNLQSTDGSSTGTFTVHLDYVHFHDQQSIAIKATLTWAPSQELIDASNAEYLNRMTAYTAEKERRFKEAFYKAARERVTLASQIQPRPAAELREEERTVVYRSLISQLMHVGTHESKHVISELVRSIFDVDKMLYFVAPEWWSPRARDYGQRLGEQLPPEGGTQAPKKAPVEGGGNLFGGMFGSGVNITPGTFRSIVNVLQSRTRLPAETLVDWGGGREAGRDNYYITEESAPAKFGSSLGWLLQLDGDNLRNAFLNAPWVKAVMPIRPGKERQAINWLRQAHVEGSDGLDARYVAAADDPPELHSTPGDEVTVEDALNFLIGQIAEFNRNSRALITPNPADPDDPRNHFAGSMPTEAIFEHGFYALQNGVRFDQDATQQVVFAQWMEILPTDQVAALQVEYDPKTLQVRDPQNGGEEDGATEDEGNGGDDGDHV